jgi:hypothetical protein
MKVTYDQIEPNIAEVDVQGERVTVTWKCPVSGKVVGESIAQMESDQVASAVKSGVARAVVFEGMSAIVQAIGQRFGMFGSKVASAAMAPMSGGVIQSVGAPRFTEAARRKAVVVAFVPVEAKFEWDEDRGLFVASKSQD